MFSDKFIRLGEKPNRYDCFVSAPWFRKAFTLEKNPEKAVFTIGTPGFYRAFINGKEITKGLFAPYISNPDHVLCYDEYDVTELLTEGVNVLVVLAGNGNVSSPGGSVWDFDRFPWTDAAKVAFAFDIDGVTTESGTDVKCRESHVYFDDLRSGERADGRLFDAAIFEKDYDDSGWKNAIEGCCPKGEKRLTDAHPITYTGNDYEGKDLGIMTVSDEYHPHKMSWGEPHMEPAEDFMKGDARVFDFGINTTGVPVFTVDGIKGQRLEFQFAEYIDNEGRISYRNINFFPDGYSQRDVYICKGEKDEVYQPSFTYHGARYCAVFGLEEGQSFSMKYRQISTVKSRFVDFDCSDKDAVKLFDMSVNSDISNFVYFPTDCPHREKNGWTGDAANSSQRMLMFYDVYNDCLEWMRHVRLSQDENGMPACIVPTDKWGYGDGCGPSWDKVLALMPWNAYRYSGRKEILEENCEAVYRYIQYIKNHRLDKDGLVKKDLGDWLCIGYHKRCSDKVSACASMCAFIDCAVKIFGECGKDDYINEALKLREDLIAALRKFFVNPYNSICDNGGESAQSLAIMHGIFTEEEKEKALENLVCAIKAEDNHICFGLQGATALFPVLFENGLGDLAWEMIMRRDYPSYAHFLEQGLTSMPESFFHDDLRDIDSLNHHMFGNIAQFFVEWVAGLSYDCGRLTIQPCYVEKLSFAEAKYSTEKGEITFRWERKDGEIYNTLTLPEGTEMLIDYRFVRGNLSIKENSITNGDRKSYSLFH